jgi:transposase InsO family protein
VQTIRVLVAIWEASGYPWSVRLKGHLSHWLPWARKHYSISSTVEQQLFRISARQIDRRLAEHKRKIKRRLYGRTKPGTLLKHQIPIKTEHWDVRGPGFAEIDLVSSSGDNASGEFIHSLNLTDIHTGWVETRAVMGKSEAHVRAALEEIRAALPFPLKAIDSDNGSEFINHHLVRYCREHSIAFTRGRPYKKDDNAHIEQKNWTHVRKLLGWERYDSERALQAINALYTADLRLMQNLFQASVKLIGKKRVGSRLRRRYDMPRTPLDRVAECADADAAALAHLKQLRDRLDPFRLSRSIDQQLDRIYALADRRHSPKTRRPGAVEAAAPDGKAAGAQTNARPSTFPQGLGRRSASSTAPTAQTDTHPERIPTTRVTKAPPTPIRAKPVDGPSKTTRMTPPTGFRRRSGRSRSRTSKTLSSLPRRVTSANGATIDP